MKNIVRRYRREREESQQALANAVGLSRQAINKIERQKVTPNGDTMLAIAKHFQVDVSDIFFADDVSQELQREEVIS